MTSVLGTLSNGTKVLQGLPGKSGKAFEAIDDNAIALDEADELSGALCGTYDGEDPDVEAQLDSDLGLTKTEDTPVPSEARVPTFPEGSVDLGLPAVCTDPLISREALLALSLQEPKLPGI